MPIGHTLDLVARTELPLRIGTTSMLRPMAWQMVPEAATPAASPEASRTAHRKDLRDEPLCTVILLLLDTSAALLSCSLKAGIV